MDWGEVPAMSVVSSNGQRLEAGEAVGVLGEQHGVAIHADLTEVGSEVVRVIALTEGVSADLSDVVVLSGNADRVLC